MQTFAAICSEVCFADFAAVRSSNTKVWFHLIRADFTPKSKNWLPGPATPLGTRQLAVRWGSEVILN